MEDEKQNLQLEVWQSNIGKEEYHFYIEDTDKYVGGFNPEFISKDAIKKFMRENNFVVKGYRTNKKLF